MKTDEELLEAAKDLYKRLGGIGNPDARLVRGLMERWQAARTPGPATANLVGWLGCVPLVDGQHSVYMPRGLVEAFLAEHGAAKAEGGGR